MLFGAYQSGGSSVLGLNMADLRRGDDYTLLDGTETLASGSSSVAFAAGPDPHGGGIIASSFYVQGCGNGSEWTIQGSNGPSTADNPSSPTSTLNAFDATFQDLANSDTTGNGVFTEGTGTSVWYRFHVKTLANGDAPVVKVRRA